MPQVEVKTQSADAFKQEIKSASHHFVADAPKEAGGTEGGPDPHELLLGALGACTSITMQMYAKRKGWDLKEVKIKVTEEKIDDASNPGQSIPRINREIIVGGNLPADQVEALKAIADKCPIHKLLSGPKQIVTAISHN
jgi:putative redox protein